MFPFGPSINFSSSEDEEFRKNANSLTRNLRDASNIFELPNNIFNKTFRVNKETFLSILNQLKIDEGIRSTYITPTHQLAVTLNILSGAPYQRQAGGDWIAPMSQACVSKIFSKVLNKMEQVLCPKMIKFTPSATTKEYFLEKYGLPGVVGVIDGSHVTILRPKDNEHMFYNRKGRHSINVMIICDENQKILAVNVMYGGCAHDSFVWAQSAERAEMELDWTQNKNNSWLLGDKGYPLEPFLITPYRSALPNSPESKFNEVHSKLRSIIERCIGILKMRWRIILEERKCRYHPKKVGKIINVCAALHNICIEYNIPLEEESIDVEPEPEDIVQQNSNRENFSVFRREAVDIRNRIRDSLSI